MQNEQDEKDDKDASQEPPQKRRCTVDEKDEQCIRRETTVGLDARTRSSFIHSFIHLFAHKSIQNTQMQQDK